MKTGEVLEQIIGFPPTPISKCNLIWAIIKSAVAIEQAFPQLLYQ